MSAFSNSKEVAISADVAVLKTEVGHIKTLVERNHKEGFEARAEIKKDVAEIHKSIDAFKTEIGTSMEEFKVDLNERRGAEKLASAIRMTLAGTIGAGFVKIAAWVTTLPIKP